MNRNQAIAITMHVMDRHRQGHENTARDAHRMNAGGVAASI